LLYNSQLRWAYPVVVPAWNGQSVAPGQRANNQVVVPALSFSLSFSGPHLAVVQRGKIGANADEHAFTLF